MKGIITCVEDIDDQDDRVYRPPHRIFSALLSILSVESRSLTMHIYMMVLSSFLARVLHVDAIHPSIYLSIYLSIDLTLLSIYISTFLSIYIHLE